MPASFVFDAVTVAPGRQTAWFTFEWEPQDHPNKGPVVCMASPASGGQAQRQLVVEDFSMCRHSPPKTYVFYAGVISNLGTEPTFARIMGVYFPEFQGDWES
jgi:hypothetical protein